MTPSHLEWLAQGEAHVSRGHLRRALSAFRKSQQVDLRGEQSFAQHTAINALTSMLLQQNKFFLNINDEQTLFERTHHVALTEIDFTGLTTEAPSADLAECLRARALLPRYADQPLLGGRDAFTRERWLPAFDALYVTLLNREES